MAAFDRPEYDRYVRLAEMMISFLRDHGYNYDANLDQDILDHDGPGVPVENGVDAIIEFNLTPPKDMITLFGQVHDENPWCDEEYEQFRDYLREREDEHQSGKLIPPSADYNAYPHTQVIIFCTVHRSGRGTHSHFPQ